MTRGGISFAVLTVLAIGASQSEAKETDIKICNAASKYREAAIEACTRLLRNPTKGVSIPTTFNLRGQAYRALGQFEKAAADHTTAITLWNGEGKAYYGYEDRANVYMDQGEFEKALTDLDAALRLSPRNGAIHYNRSLVWALKGDRDRQLADLKIAIEANPKDATSINSRALIELERQEFESALADFNRVVMLRPNARHGYTMRAYYWMKRGELERALEDANKGVKLQDANDRFLSLGIRGDIYRYMGNIEAALKDYSQVLSEYPNHALFLANRGLAHEKAGNLAEAKSDFEAAARAKRAPDASAEIDFVQGRATASARLAAYSSDAPQPVVATVTGKGATPNSIPTPAIAVPSKTLQVLRTERRVALVIGNSAYTKVDRLLNPKNDADAIAASLRSVGFQTVLLNEDLPKQQMTDALRSFANEAEGADWAMVYYAGHGIEVNGLNYLIPVDAKLATDRDIQFEAVPLDSVLAAVEGAKKIKIVMLDACRDNPFTPQMRKTVVPEAVVSRSTGGAVVATRSVGRGLAEVKVSGATLVVYAAKQGQTALDGDGKNSPFAVAVAQRLATPGVEINKIFRLVRDDVMEATGGRQEPYTYGSLPGREDFFFIAK